MFKVLDLTINDHNFILWFALFCLRISTNKKVYLNLSPDFLENS